MKPFALQKVFYVVYPGQQDKHSVCLHNTAGNAHFLLIHSNVLDTYAKISFFVKKFVNFLEYFEMKIRALCCIEKSTVHFCNG